MTTIYSIDHENHIVTIQEKIINDRNTEFFRDLLNLQLIELSSYSFDVLIDTENTQYNTSYDNVIKFGLIYLTNQQKIELYHKLRLHYNSKMYDISKLI